MSDRADVKKTRGVWMITVTGAEDKKKDIPEQSNNHQNEQTDEKMRGGAR